MGGMGGGEETEVEKNWQFRKPFPNRFLCRKEKRNEKRMYEKSLELKLSLRLTLQVTLCTFLV